MSAPPRSPNTLLIAASRHRQARVNNSNVFVTLTGGNFTQVRARRSPYRHTFLPRRECVVPSALLGSLRPASHYALSTFFPCTPFVR